MSVVRPFVTSCVIGLWATCASAQALVPPGRPGVLFFIQSDCPISNTYAPEIQRICKAYEAKGVSCSLAYEDVEITQDAMRAHLKTYGYGNVTAAIDASRALADRAHAAITPHAVLIDGRGQVRYSGRIDNLYSSLGKPRQVVTEHDLIDALDSVLAGKPVAHPQTEALGCFITRPEPPRKTSR